MDGLDKDELAIITNLIDSILSGKAFLRSTAQLFLFLLLSAIFCCLYALTMNQKNAQKRFINLPITYSSLSITGWVYYFFVEIISLFIAKKYFDISIKNILIVSSTYMLLECSFSFTFGFFIMETLHRKIFMLDIVILITFGHYYSSPLKKLKEETEKVKKGDYTEHIKIVSNDSFGELADTFNDMITSIDMNNKKLLAVQNSILTGMATMVESRDNSTGGHIKRTSECVRIFVNYLKSKPEYSKLSEKLAGEQIPFEARIMALADVFDALVSKRCYKESFSFDKAFEIISESAGSHFAPALTKQFIQCRNKLGALYSAI